MSKTLSIAWSNPTPHSECGYKAYYRRNQDTSYTELDTSGSTSGTTTVSTLVSAPANFEGYVVADCCSGSTSAEVPFGINSYVPFDVTITINTLLQTFNINVTSEYGNPYDTVITGTIYYTFMSVPLTVDYTITYPAGDTDYTTTAGVAATGAVLDNNIVTAWSPVYDYGGDLQQYDAVNTPPYFRLYWADSSGATAWSGSPTELPSFLLMAFNTTEVDEDDNVLQGNLIVSWIQQTVYADAEPPYDRITMEVYDPGNALVGQVILNPGIVGLRSGTIVLNRTSPSYPLDATTEFTMKCFWDNEALISSYSFYLPV